MRISARNQISGTIVDVTKGATTSHVRVDIGGGKIITSSITNAAVDELGLKAGGKDNGAAGHRKDYSPTYYAAFLLDPDGNNVEAVST